MLIYTHNTLPIAARSVKANIIENQSNLGLYTEFTDFTNS